MRKGFTLIELLVVITIIVVLLALLTPALDRAIYQAELAACGAQNRGIASGVTIYAMDHNRRYPARTGASSALATIAGIHPHLLSDPGQGYNIMPHLRDYFSINGMLQDPLAGTVDLEGSQPETWVWGNYYLWFGWQFVAEEYGPQSGMFKLGDRWSWDGAKFNVIVQDSTNMQTADDITENNHPDDAGILVYGEAQDYEAVSGGLIPAGSGMEVGIRATGTWWNSAATYKRGRIEMNYALADGSVARLDKLEWSEGEYQRNADGTVTHISDERVWRTPHHTTIGGWPEWYSQVPKR